MATTITLADVPTSIRSYYYAFCRDKEVTDIRKSPGVNILWYSVGFKNTRELWRWENGGWRRVSVRPRRNA